MRRMRTNNVGLGVVVRPEFGPAFGIIDVHAAEIESIINDFGRLRVMVVSWGDYAKGKPLYESREYVKIKDLLAGDS